MQSDFCLRCGLQKDDKKHDTTNREGWHTFRDQKYLDDLEDALLFIREKQQPHTWEETGITIDTYPEFSEKVCSICGGINWGGKEDSICFGNENAEHAIWAAHNRRASTKTPENWGFFYTEKS